MSYTQILRFVTRIALWNPSTDSSVRLWTFSNIIILRSEPHVSALIFYRAFSKELRPKHNNWHRKIVFSSRSSIGRYVNLVTVHVTQWTACNADNSTHICMQLAWASRMYAGHRACVCVCVCEQKCICVCVYSAEHVASVKNSTIHLFTAKRIYKTGLCVRDCFALWHIMNNRNSHSINLKKNWSFFPFVPPSSPLAVATNLTLVCSAYLAKA